MAQGTYSVLYNDLYGKRILKRVHLYISVADSFCYTAETNITLQISYTPTKINLKKQMK